jgi:hypothetical protein
MATTAQIDGILIQWGDRLFYPGNRIVKGKLDPRWRGGSDSQRAAAIRARIQATVVRRAPQVMVKVTGGGRGMAAIAAHWRYISKNGRLEIEDELGCVQKGRDALQALADDWRFGGTPIDEVGHRREAFNIMLSMPRGTDPLMVQQAARGLAQAELADHKFVMVLHDHQANPHVHISVRAESRHGKRLNLRKADLQRWRETFAEKLRGYGIEAEPTLQATRGRSQNYDPLWRVKARQDGRLRVGRPSTQGSPKAAATRADAIEAWRQIGLALAKSGSPADIRMAGEVSRLLRDMSTGQSTAVRSRTPGPPAVDTNRQGPNR